ncbi:Txe/YoeB family addiction module toxin [Nostoc sp. CHAB 5834]|nr:Txe/YoeB family addiction module toxin [Nostoc sp. CHAB 5834]
MILNCKILFSNLKEKAEELLAVLQDNPFQNPPPYEKLVGDLSGAYSRRINIQHRLVYKVIRLLAKVFNTPPPTPPRC